MEQAVALTVDYTRNRQQFGMPLARFQVLQHRMVDMQTHVEQARSLVYLAASLIDTGDSEAQAQGSTSRTQAVAAMQVLVLEAARYVSQQAVQLHGGIGVTDEYIVSHYFRKLTQMEISFGDTLHHLGEVSARMQNTAGVFA